jgi:hypothetical protein
MGTYDMYGTEGIQLKVGEPAMNHYKLGARAPIGDGLYVTQDGIVLIHEGIVKFAGDVPIYSKWGEEIAKDDIIDDYDAVKQALRVFEALNNLDGSNESVVSLLSGLSSERLEELGGVSEDE